MSSDNASNKPPIQSGKVTADDRGRPDAIAREGQPPSTLQARYERPMTLEELAGLSDDEIDFSDIPELDENYFQTSLPIIPKLTLELESLKEIVRAGRASNTSEQMPDDIFAEAKEIVRARGLKHE